MILRCKDYSPDELKANIEKIFYCFPQAVKAGERILLKPNLLSEHPAEDAVTTHPELVRAVIRKLKTIGAESMVGDSPSIAENIEKLWKTTGMAKVAEEENVKLVNFANYGVKEFPSQKFAGKKIYLSSVAFEINGIISLAKLKTHNLMTFTAGIKNLYGLIPGMIKTDYHRLAYKPIFFAQLLSEILAVVKPRLTIIDGIVGMDGNGPVAGRIRNFGLILASDDVVALDTVVCKLIGLEIEEVPLLKFCAEKDLGETNLEKIEVVGEKMNIVPLEEYIIDDFLLPATEITNYAPQWLVDLLARFVWTKPKILTDKCQLCMKCSGICPVGAIISSSSKDKNRILLVDRNKCISCFCCSEACPNNAVEPQASLLLKIIRRLLRLIR